MPLGTGSDTHTQNNHTDPLSFCLLQTKQTHHFESLDSSAPFTTCTMSPALATRPCRKYLRLPRDSHLNFHAPPPPKQPRVLCHLVFKKQSKNTIWRKGSSHSVSCFVCIIYYLDYVPYPFNQTMQEILQTSQKFTSQLPPPPPKQPRVLCHLVFKKQGKNTIWRKGSSHSVSCFVCIIYYLDYVPYPFNQTMQEILQTSQKFTSQLPPPPSKTTTGPFSSCLQKTKQKHHLEEG